MRKIIAIAAALTPGIALSEQAGYSEHRLVERFNGDQCAVIISDIDGEIPTEIGPAETTDEFGKRFADAVGRKGTAWGFILGYDTANGGLHAGNESTLQRLREACEKEPERTAISILEQFAAQ